jgi:hypothetical protein
MQESSPEPALAFGVAALTGSALLVIGISVFAVSGGVTMMP